MNKHNKELKKSYLNKKPIEIWKDIPGYEGSYQVSNLGRVKSLARKVEFQRWGRLSYRHYPEKIIYTSFSKKGYVVCTLSLNKKNSTFMVHRLVALAFIPNPENKPQVNHKNAVKTDNLPNNLEWATQQENMNHAKEMNLIKGSKGEKNAMFGRTGSKNHNFGKKSPKAKPVIQKSLSGIFIRLWPCAMDAKRKLKICNKAISSCVTGVRDNYAGFKWSYAK